MINTEVSQSIKRTKYYLNIRKVLSLLLIIICSAIYAQENETLIKTSEFFNDQHKRRDLFFDKDLKLKKEIYYEKKDWDKDYKIAVIEYINETTRKSVSLYNLSGALKLFVDFEKGIYNDFEKNIVLNFKGEFIFNGIQKGNKIVVNYANGKRSGRLIQTDSAVNGSKIASSQVADPKYLQFNIIKFYNQPYTVSTFRLFNGIELNFEDDALNGTQNSFYPDSKIKFQAVYNNFRLVDFNSYTKDGTIISKVSTTNGFTINNQIINGSINSDSRFRLFYLRQLSNVGKIVIRTNIYNNGTKSMDAENNSVYKTFKYNSKILFDKEKRHFDQIGEYGYIDTDFRELFGIPQFDILKFDLQTSDDKLVDVIYFSDFDKSSNVPLLNSIKLYNYYVYGIEEPRYEKSPLPFNEFDNNPSLENSDHFENQNIVENILLRKYLLKAFGLNVNALNSKPKEIILDSTQKCLLNCTWKCQSNGDIKYYFRFSEDGTFITLTSAKNTDLEIIESRGNWVIEGPGIIEIFFTETEKYINPKQRDNIFIMSNCTTLKDGSMTYIRL